MKKTLIDTAIIGFVFATLVVACDTSSDKVDQAERNLMNKEAEVYEAKNELEAAKQSYLQDFEDYKIEKTMQIAANEQAIADLKLKIENENAVQRKDHRLQIARFESENDVLREKMKAYHPENKERWEAFKKEFNHDINELGKTIQDVFEDNVK